MGITIESKNYAIDMGYSGFNNLRTRVAKLTGNEIGEHYECLQGGMFLCGEDRKQFLKEYNERISELEYEFEIPHGILDFLYASDGSGELSVEKCEQIYEVIKDYDDNVLYGYSGRPDCAMFKDFKQIIKDCIDSKCSMEWQ